MQCCVCVINKLPHNQSCWGQLDHNCDQQNVLPPVVDDNTSLRQHTIVYANNRGKWTQKFQTIKMTFKVTKRHL